MLCWEHWETSEGDFKMWQMFEILRCRHGNPGETTQISTKAMIIFHPFDLKETFLVKAAHPLMGIFNGKPS